MAYPPQQCRHCNQVISHNGKPSLSYGLVPLYCDQCWFAIFPSQLETAGYRQVNQNFIPAPYGPCENCCSHYTAKAWHYVSPSSLRVRCEACYQRLGQQSSSMGQGGVPSSVPSPQPVKKVGPIYKGCPPSVCHYCSTSHSPQWYIYSASREQVLCHNCYYWFLWG